MAEKPPEENPPRPPLWSDLLLTVWVIVVGVVYFGGYFVPTIGALTPNVSVVYALMVLVSALMLTMRYLRRGGADKKNGNTRTKNRK